MFEDKNICYQLCQAARLPLPEQYCIASGYEEIKCSVLKILKEKPFKKIIVKPTLGKGGAGICLCYIESDELVVKGTTATGKLECFGDSSPAVLQEFVKQHEELDVISTSINTVRIVTLLTIKKDVVIIGAYMRFGVGDNFVDNVSNGGLAVAIDKEKGTLMKYGYDFNSQVHDRHPTTKKKFFGFKVPMWKSILTPAETTQYHFNYFKLFGHDIAITPEGPVIIELNAIYDNVGLEQKLGPILRDPLILKEYCNYDLLINHKQKTMCAELGLQ